MRDSSSQSSGKAKRVTPTAEPIIQALSLIHIYYQVRLLKRVGTQNKSFADARWHTWKFQSNTVDLPVPGGPARFPVTVAKLTSQFDCNHSFIVM